MLERLIKIVITINVETRSRAGAKYEFETEMMLHQGSAVSPLCSSDGEEGNEGERRLGKLPYANDLFVTTERKELLF